MDLQKKIENTINDIFNFFINENVYINNSTFGNNFIGNNIIEIINNNKPDTIYNDIIILLNIIFQKNQLNILYFFNNIFINPNNFKEALLNNNTNLKFSLLYNDENNLNIFFLFNYIIDPVYINKNNIILNNIINYDITYYNIFCIIYLNIFDLVNPIDNTNIFNFYKKINNILDNNKKNICNYFLKILIYYYFKLQIDPKQNIFIIDNNNNNIKINLNKDFIDYSFFDIIHTSNYIEIFDKLIISIKPNQPIFHNDTLLALTQLIFNVE